MRILVVDDSEDSRDLTEGALLSAGYGDVLTAGSGWDALKILDIGGAADVVPTVDMLLLDIVMPEMDGVETCARVRNDDRYADLPIIMVTSLDDMDFLTKAFVVGANDYVTKPINRIELIARVRAALRVKAELDQRRSRERELLSFLSKCGDRRATVLIDEATGLFAAEVAEAYLAAACGNESNDTMSILALRLDRHDVDRSAPGAARNVLAQVAGVVRRLSVPTGMVAAAYPDGMIVMVAPELNAVAAREVGEALHKTVSRLGLPSSEEAASDHVTASVAAITGRAVLGTDRIHLLTQAITKVQEATGAGGDRVLALTV